MKNSKTKRIAIIGSTSPSGISIAEEFIKEYSLNLTYRQESLLPQQFKNKKNIKLLHNDFENQNEPDADFFRNCDIVIWTVHIKNLSGIKQIHLNTRAIGSFLSILPRMDNA